MLKPVAYSITTKKILFLVATILVCATLFARYLSANETPLEGLRNLDSSDWESIKLALNKGEMIVLIRHTERCDRSESPCFLESEGISVKGQQNALFLAKQLSPLLKDSPSDIFNSPALRTQQTSNILFQGRSENRPWLRKDCKDALFDNIVGNKRPNRNLFLVSHSTCLRELNKNGHKYLSSIDFSQDESYGITIFLRFDAVTEDLIPMGFIFLNDWNVSGE